MERAAPAGSNDTRGCPFTPVCAKVGLGKVLGSPGKCEKSSGHFGACVGDLVGLALGGSTQVCPEEVQSGLHWYPATQPHVH